MKNHRIGNDINVAWSIFRKDEPFNLEGLDAALYIKDMYGRKAQNFAIDGNVVLYKFKGADQKHTGRYSLELVINEGKLGMITTGYRNFVNLVFCDCKDCEVEDFEFASELGFVADIIDDELNVNSENSISNKAVTTALYQYGAQVYEMGRKVDNTVQKVGTDLASTITKVDGNLSQATAEMAASVENVNASLASTTQTLNKALADQTAEYKREFAAFTAEYEKDYAAQKKALDDVIEGQEEAIHTMVEGQLASKADKAELATLSDSVELFKATTTKYEYGLTLNNYLNGSINSMGQVASYGKRTEPLQVKKGDIIQGKKFNGTPAYAYLSRLNEDGTYTALFVPQEIGVSEFSYTTDNDMSVVFSSSSAAIEVIISHNKVYDQIYENTQKIEMQKNELMEKPNKSELHFFGFGIDEATSTYEYNRRVSLPFFNLKQGACFIVQMGEVIYHGYADVERTLTLNVNNTGAKRVKLDGTWIQPKYSWEKGDMLFLYYDGEDYQATGIFGQSRANALWADSLGTSAIDLYDTAEEVEFPNSSYFACKIAVTKGTILFINTFCSAGLAFISQILEDGTIKVLEYGDNAYKGYKIDRYRYLYEVKEDMVLRITYSKQNRPKIIAFNSYLTQFIESAKTSIAKLLTDIATKASVSEMNAKASAADLAAETAAREAAILELQRQINEFDFSGDIESVVKDYIAEHPEVVTSIQDNTITEAKFTESVRHKKPSIYTNVAEMIADTTLEVGMTAITKGYYAENDGGAGQYTIVARQTENGGSYISLNNGLTASLNFDGKTYILSQWGVRGDGELRTARSVYPFLTTSAIKETNDHFDDSVSDATYMIQYLMNLSRYRNCDIVIDGKVYKITHTIFVQPMVTLRGHEDGAPRSNWIEQQQFYYCNSSLVLIKAGIPMFAGDKFFDTTGNGYSNIQLLCMKNFNARGIFGTDIEGDAGSFLDTKNMSLTRSLFKHLNLAGFGTGFNIIEQCYWTIFDTLNLYRMRDNGIYMGYNENVETSGQKNANSIMNCVIFGCGMDYDKSSKQYVNKYGATSDAANRLPINKPTPNRGNCIVVSYSGNYISNCDVSDAAVGVYRAAYSNGTTIVGLYSEEISMAQIYNDYTSGNVDSAELGGYLRVDKWTDSAGGERQNKKVANPTDFVE